MLGLISELAAVSATRVTEREARAGGEVSRFPQIPWGRPKTHTSFSYNHTDYSYTQPADDSDSEDEDDRLEAREIWERILETANERLEVIGAGYHGGADPKHMLVLLKAQRRELASLKRQEKEVGKGGLASQRGASQKRRDDGGGLTHY